MQNEMRHSLIAIVMSHLSLEALINTIGTAHYVNHRDPIRKEIWVKQIERYSLKNKFKTVAQQIYEDKTGHKNGKTLNEDTLDKIEYLKELRHSIVHYKPKPEDTRVLKKTSNIHVISPELEKYTSKKAKTVIKTVVEVIEAFNKLAGTEYGEWKDTILKKHSMKA